jgi:hypothetical protein
MDDPMDRHSEPADLFAEVSTVASAPPSDSPAAIAGPGDDVVAGRPDRGLTRVAIDPSQLIDERSAAWCRHEVRRIVAWHLIGTAAAVAGILTPVIWWSLGDPVLAVLLAVVGAVVVTSVRLGFALVAAPLGYRYVQRFSTSPPEYLLAHPAIVESDAPTAPLPSFLQPGPSSTVGPQFSAPVPPPGPTRGQTERQTSGAFGGGPADVWDLDPEASDSIAWQVTAQIPAQAPALWPSTTPPAELGAPAQFGAPATALVDLDGTPVPERHAATAELLRALGFAPVATLRTDGIGGRYLDLYGDSDRIVVAVDRTSATTTVLTELAGFRVLVTSALLVPPTDELVVNVVAKADPATLVRSHRLLVQRAFRSRTRVSEPVGLFKLAQQRELEAYRELGPLWGAVLDLRCRPRGVRLLAAPSAGDVLLFTGNRLFRQTAHERAS